jgi:hypothetical protein
MYSDGDLLKGGVAPFGYPRIKACSRLPMAFRSVPRPSSPPGAKASTECPYRAQNPHEHPLPREKNVTPTMHRNHPQNRGSVPAHRKTSRATNTNKVTHTFFTRAHERLFRGRELQDTQRHPSPRQTCRPRYAHRRTRTYSIAKDQHPQNAQKHPSGSLIPPTTTPGSLNQTSHTQSQKPWWRWTGSNRRPPACKAGALPAELHPQLWWAPFLVGQGGLEPPTPRLSSVCSNQLSY